jgi:hypothetical protein
MPRHLAEGPRHLADGESVFDRALPKMNALELHATFHTLNKSNFSAVEVALASIRGMCTLKLAASLNEKDYDRAIAYAFALETMPDRPDRRQPRHRGVSRTQSQILTEAKQLDGALREIAER